MSQYTGPDMFVFLDESAVDGLMGLRAKMAGPLQISQLLREVHPLRCPPFYTPRINPARDGRSRDLRGFRHERSVHSVFTREHSKPCNHFTIVCCTHCKQAPFPGKHGIVVMDDCSIHHDQEIEARRVLAYP